MGILTNMRVLIVWLATLLMSLAAQAERSRILENVDIVDSSSGPQLVITFNHTVRYISHSPRSANDIFEIQMASKALFSNVDEGLIGSETLQWSPNPAVPLLDITYESEVTGSSRLTLRFQRPVSLTIMSGKDVRTLTIQLPPPPVTTPRPTALLEDVQIPSSASTPIREAMEAARQAVAAKDFSSAIRLYEKVLRKGSLAVKPIALEFLGVAREKNGQRAQAKAVYQRYLAEYPEGGSAERVQQRLTGLVTAAKRPPKQLREAKAKPGGRSDWQIFGGVSQFYRRDNRTTDLDGDNEFTSITSSSLTNNLDLSGRLRTDTYSVRTRFSGGYEYDFLGADGPGNETRLSSLYAKISDRKRRLHLQAGRQSGNKGGVLGRFDGALFSVQLPKQAKLHLVAGYPVNSSRNGLETSKRFYGANIDLKPFGKNWGLNAFAIQQTVDGLIDRRAIGGEVRYFVPGRSFFTLGDYDLLYDELNTLLFLGHWTFPDNTTVNLSLDYRKSPILSTSNALQSQMAESLEVLLNTFDASEIQQLAQDRTATSRLATLGVSRPLMENLQINGDLTISNFSSTPASGGVEATPATGNDYSLNVQLVRSNWLKTGDIHILGTRFSDTSSSSTSTVSLNSRYPVNPKLRINPRFRIDLRDNVSDGSSQTTYKPSLRMTYKLKRRFRVEANMGGEWSNKNLTDDTNKTQSWFVNVGYRLDF